MMFIIPLVAAIVGSAMAVALTPFQPAPPKEPTTEFHTGNKTLDCHLWGEYIAKNLCPKVFHDSATCQNFTLEYGCVTPFSHCVDCKSAPKRQRMSFLELVAKHRVDEWGRHFKSELPDWNFTAPAPDCTESDSNSFTSRKVFTSMPPLTFTDIPQSISMPPLPSNITAHMPIPIETDISSVTETPSTPVPSLPGPQSSETPALSIIDPTSIDMTATGPRSFTTQPITNTPPLSTFDPATMTFSEGMSLPGPQSSEPPALSIIDPTSIDMTATGPGYFTTQPITNTPSLPVFRFPEETETPAIAQRATKPCVECAKCGEACDDAYRQCLKECGWWPECTPFCVDYKCRYNVCGRCPSRCPNSGNKCKNGDCISN